MEINIYTILLVSYAGAVTGALAVAAEQWMHERSQANHWREIANDVIAAYNEKYLERKDEQSS